ncbi:unnamed protein product [Trichogramma brassicae]|uniref:DNA-directed RNA polymerase III subunit RPC5 n=1 Tax=Trichogramma brassicae TaxID=86971 RepID=A0A6H5I117_9HYME|nr:unnamed protein product [Trichogramma brassicae]
MDEDVDDPVVEEIPVYVSTKLADKLYIFQYPEKSTDVGYDNEIFLETSMKPENEEVKIQVQLDTQSEHYDESQGEFLAANNVESTTRKKEKQLFKGDQMDRIFLKSSRAEPNCDNYAIAIYQNDELHITPLKGIIQMRPDFSYLDRVDKKFKDSGKNGGEGFVDADDEEPEEIEVHAKFTKNISDYAKQQREKSFQTHARKSMEEEWVPCKFQRAEEPIKEEMFCHKVDNDRSNDLKITQSDYLNILVPVKNTKLKSNVNMNPINTLSYIKTLPLLEQISLLLKDAKIMTFEHLRAIISSEHDDGKILKILHDVAVLVQDNWVVNSDIIYNKEYISDSGIESEFMRRARNYILLCYTEREYIQDRAEICSTVKLPIEEVTQIIDNLAIYEPQKGWRLLVNSTEFAKKYVCTLFY